MLSVVLIGVAIAGTACSANTGSPTPSVRQSQAASPTFSATASMPAPTASALLTQAPSCAEQALASLNEAQRIGQLFLVGLKDDQLDAAERAAIAAYHFGSWWFTAKTTIGVAGVRAVADAVQAEAMPEATGGVRFFVAANQEGGLIQALAGPGFDTIPSALAQGTWAPSTLQAKAARWGRQLSSAGINLNFAPVADVVPPGTDAQNAPIGQLQREFGHDAGTVESHVVAFIAGMHSAGVATTVKHFPGLGRVAGNTDFTASVVDTVTTRQDPYLAPFGAAITAGVPFVMVAEATYTRIDPSHLAVFSRAVVGGMLRGDLAFHGLVISDSLTAEAVSSIPPATRAVAFVAAGGTMIVSNTLAPTIVMAQGLASRAATDPTLRGRIDDAALRVLQAKAELGLLNCGG